MARELMSFEGRHFVYKTKFNSEPDKFGNKNRYANINLTEEEAMNLKAKGFIVKQTEASERYPAEWYTKINLNYDDNEMLWPKVYLVSDDNEPYLYSANNIHNVDDLWIGNVDVVCAPYEYRPGEFNLYVRFMYLTQNVMADPYYNKYFKKGENE